MTKTTTQVEDDYFVCYDCCTAPLLKELVVRYGQNSNCSLCENSSVNCIHTGNDIFLLAVKALIRYHFSEWQYHSRLGDGSLESLFYINPNPILKINPNQDDIEREAVILSFLDRVNSHQKQIEVITAYGRDIYNYTPHTPIFAGESEILNSAKIALEEKNYFLVEEEYEKILRPVMPYISSVVYVGTKWYRARGGAKQRAANFNEIGFPLKYFYEPHKDSAIGSPPVGVATAGRVNRPGVSYLYLASNSATAAAEIRPHPGELVSVAIFEIIKSLRIVDLRSHDLRKLWQSDSELEMLELIIAMEKIFLNAAPPSNRSAYTLTQFLGEIFRRLGFDGVMFKSTVGDGDNLVAFNPAHAKWTSGSSKAIEVKRVFYELADVDLFDENRSYNIDFNDFQK